jgi:hypothetical protein
VRIENFDFENDVREHVLDNLPCEPEFRAALEAEDAHSLLIIYANWAERMISAVPRIIHEAKALISNPLSSDPRYKPGLDAIRQKIVQGDDLTGHLSKRITKGYRPSQTDQMNLNRRPDLDLMLSDWGVHHLHISENIESDGFVERTGPLIFAVFHRDAAYLIDIFEHGAWADKSIIRIIIHEWPNTGIVYKVPGIMASLQPHSDTDHIALRGVGINSAIEIDGNVWKARSGITTAGSSLSATMGANKLWHQLKEFLKKINSEPLWLKEIIISLGLPIPERASLKFVFYNGRYGILEEQTELFIPLSE